MKKRSTVPRNDILAPFNVQSVAIHTEVYQRLSYMAESKSLPVGFPSRGKPKNVSRETFPVSERSAALTTSTYLSGDAEARTKKIALYQAWLGETWLSSAIDGIAKRIMSGGWMLDPTDRHKPDDKSKPWVQEFFDWCNLDEDMTSVMLSSFTDLGWCGECYLEVTWRYNRTFKREIPYEIYTVDPISMDYIVAPNKKEIVGYRQSNDEGKSVSLAPRQIIRVWFPDPRNRFRALSYLERMLNPIVLDTYLQVSEQKYFQQGNRGDIAIIAPKMDTTAAMRLLEHIEEHALGIKNMHRPLFLWGEDSELKVQDLPNRAALDIPGRRDAMRKEMGAGFHFPPHLWGIVEDGNIGGQGAAATMDKNFQHTTANAWKQKLYEAVNFNIIYQGFGVNDWVFNSTYADVRDDKEILDIEIEELSHGLTTINKLLAKRKMDPVPGGDVPIMILGSKIVPVSQLTNTAALMQTPTENPNQQSTNGQPSAKTPEDRIEDAEQKSQKMTKVKATPDQTMGIRKTQQRPQAIAEKPPEESEILEGQLTSKINLSEGTYSYGCILAPLSHEDQNYVDSIHNLIDSNDLHADDASKDSAHITVKYGLMDCGPTTQHLTDSLASILPFSVLIQDLALFQIADQDILIFPVESPELHMLNGIICKYLPHEDTFKDYRPHVTVAYLKSGMGVKYTSLPTFRNLPQKMLILRSLELSTPDGKRYRYPTHEWK